MKNEPLKGKVCNQDFRSSPRCILVRVSDLRSAIEGLKNEFSALADKNFLESSTMNHQFQSLIDKWLKCWEDDKNE